MSEPCQLQVYDGHQPVYSADLTGPAELGRQNKGEQAPYCQLQTVEGCRIVLARLDEDMISRRHLRIEPLPEGRVRLTNLSQRQAVRLADGSRLEPGASSEARLPTTVMLGSRTIRLQLPTGPEADENLQSLSEMTRAPGRDISLARVPLGRSLMAGPSVGVEDLVGWIEAALGVLQGAAGSTDFFLQAARAVVDLAGLDSARVLLRQDDDWNVHAVQNAPDAPPETDWQPSRQVLARLVAEKRTFWQVPSGQHADSLRGVKAVVAAPILDRHGQVIGALYGDRRHRSATWRPISRLEALLVQVLAGAVAAGLARLEQEQAAVRARVQLEQFFTRSLYQELEAHPELLDPRDADVTVLFCDIRGFSRISEKLGAARTVEWIRDVMGALSECILAEEGVVVEYIGDELMAMWGAPAQASDHAARACRAALALLGQLPVLNERWAEVLGEPMDLGIGINSGSARVGNIGSRHKFKYGPLGNTVNLASRVQGATKYLKTRILLTRAVRDQLGEDFALRRLCQVRVVNIHEPVELYELAAANRPEWQQLRKDYEAALTHFETGHVRTAVRILANVHCEYPDDGPTLVLLARAVAGLARETTPLDPVWELPGK
jgi:adenylate cyclase